MGASWAFKLNATAPLPSTQVLLEAC